LSAVEPGVAVTPVSEIVASLARAPTVILPMVRQADPVVLKRRPDPGKWSIHEHACHLAAVHPVFQARLTVMLETENPVIRSYDPGRDEPDGVLLGQDLNEALSRFEQERRVFVQRLERLPPDAWGRPARHEEYNSYSVLTMCRHFMLHDFLHAYRIEELLLRKDWPAPLPDPGR